MFTLQDHYSDIISQLDVLRTATTPLLPSHIDMMMDLLEEKDEVLKAVGRECMRTQ